VELLNKRGDEMTFIKFVVLSVIMVVVAACSPDQLAVQPTSEFSDAETLQLEAVYQTLSIDELITIVDNKADGYTIVNVHIPYAGEIQETVANTAFNDIDALTSTLPDKDAPIILYRRSGNMSETATRELVALGYTNVYDVPGGMNAWQSSGRELEFLE
jgi:rhodanese-related sulfurtransferase